MSIEIIKTADGSHSLYVKELNEHYHSIHGAIQESKHVFIEAGLNYFLKINPKNISILEIGFGTGLNTFLTYLKSTEINMPIHYTSLEAFPISMELVNELNYADLLSDSKIDNSSLKNTFKSIHTCIWENDNLLSDNFTLKKINKTLQKIIFNDTFDIIYFDAFGPRVQPELWTEEIFRKIYNNTSTKGVLVTYCAKGEVKRTLKKIGFTIESLQGPPGKREMLRAVKN